MTLRSSTLSSLFAAASFLCLRVAFHSEVWNQQMAIATDRDDDHDGSGSSNLSFSAEPELASGRQDDKTTGRRGQREGGESGGP